MRFNPILVRLQQRIIWISCHEPLRFNPILVRLQPVAVFDQKKNGAVSIPSWFDYNEFKKFGLIAPWSSFNPILVRLQRAVIAVDKVHRPRFNPILVRLQPKCFSPLEWGFTEFQSHLGSITTL